MSKNVLAETLLALASSRDRSETARLRDVFDEVEIALKAGVSRTLILKVLHEQGFTMTAKSFENTLYRLRKKHKNNSLLRKNAQHAQNVLSEKKSLQIFNQDSILEANNESINCQKNLTSKEKREKRADQYIKEVPSFLLKALKDKEL